MHARLHLAQWCTVILVTDRSPLSFSLWLRRGRGWNEPWIKYKEWPGFARILLIPRHPAGYIRPHHLWGTVIQCTARGRALPGSFSGGSRMHFDPSALSLSCLSMHSLPPVILVFHLSISVILSALIFPRACLFPAALHLGNSVQEPELT